MSSDRSKDGAECLALNADKDKLRRPVYPAVFFGTSTEVIVPGRLRVNLTVFFLPKEPAAHLSIKHKWPYIQLIRGDR